MVLSLKLIGLSLPFFKSDYLYAFDLYHVVFLLTLYLGVAVQPSLKKNQINKKKKKKKNSIGHRGTASTEMKMGMI